MTFSVIIPCYNCVKTLKTTVDSICASGLSDYEILLVDDGATDGTAELCDRLCREYSNIRCIHQPNAGVSAARNRGIDDARGKYIWFVDADDVVEQLSVEPIQKAVLDGTDCIMFGMQFLYLWHGKTVRQESLSCGSAIKLEQQELGKYFQMLFEKNYLTAIWNKLIRKSVLIENGIYFDQNLINYEDLQFSVLLIAHCKKIIALPETYYHYINTFGIDRTVERIQRIPDVIADTDKIAAPFYALSKQLCEPVEGLSGIILRLYMEAAYFKLKTANRAEMKRLCTTVQKNENIRLEACAIGQLSQADQRLYRWMMNNSYEKIRLFMGYRALRSIGSRCYRIAISYLGR